MVGASETRHLAEFHAGEVVLREAGWIYHSAKDVWSYNGVGWSGVAAMYNPYNDPQRRAYAWDGNASGGGVKLPPRRQFEFAFHGLLIGSTMGIDVRPPPGATYSGGDYVPWIREMLCNQALARRAILNLCGVPAEDLMYETTVRSAHYQSVEEEFLPVWELPGYHDLPHRAGGSYQRLGLDTRPPGHVLEYQTPGVRCLWDVRSRGVQYLDPDYTPVHNIASSEIRIAYRGGDGGGYGDVSQIKDCWFDQFIWLVIKLMDDSSYGTVPWTQIKEDYAAESFERQRRPG